MDIVNEGTTSYLTATFKDKAGIPQAPASATFTVIDRESGNEIIAETALTPGTSIEIALTPTANTLQNQAAITEVRRVIVKGTYGASDAVKGAFDYRVLNLSKVP